MKTKKIFVVLSLFVLLLGLATMGVSAMATKLWNQTINKSQHGWYEKGSITQKFDNQYNLQLDELTQYDYKAFAYAHGGRHVIDEFSSNLYTLHHFNGSFPVELIKTIDSDNLCVVYKLEKDNKEIFSYVLFKRRVSEFSGEDGSGLIGSYEIWEKTGEVYFVSKILSSADFADVAIGDVASEVNKIDTAVSFDEDFGGYYRISKGIKHIGFISYRLLLDGIMLIEFEAEVDQVTNEIPSFEEFKVVSKTFYSYDDYSNSDYPSVIHSSDILE